MIFSSEPRQSGTGAERNGRGTRFESGPEIIVPRSVLREGTK